MTPRIGFAGMTHLGLVSATGLCSKGFETVCFDPNAGLIENLKAGRLPVLEPGLDEMLTANGPRQIFSASLQDLAACDVVYIAPDVPTDDEGRSDLSNITGLIQNVIPHLGPQAILVVLCQVPPGFTRGLHFAPERLFYQVETLIFGRAVERAVAPERYIVGCANPARPLPPALQEVLAPFDCPILPMGYESAELAKISINMCLVASISVANTMAELCEKVGAAWDEITPALKLDRRIGAFSYLTPGLGIAGGNLERDLATVIRLSEHHQTDAGVVRAWIANSQHRRDWAAHTIRAALSNVAEPVLAVWGLAYKENTHSVKNSPSLATLAQLRDYSVKAHDPAVPAARAEHPRAEGAPTPLDALRGADALAILTPWPEYGQIPPSKIADGLRGRIVVDPYRVLDPRAAQQAGLDYYTLGMPHLTGSKAN